MRASPTVHLRTGVVRATDACAGGFDASLPPDLAAPWPSYGWMTGDWDGERGAETPKSPWFSEFEEME